MDPMMDLVRQRTDDLRRVADDLRRERDLRTAATPSADPSTSAGIGAARHPTNAAVCDGGSHRTPAGQVA